MFRRHFQREQSYKPWPTCLSEINVYRCKRKTICSSVIRPKTYTSRVLTRRWIWNHTNQKVYVSRSHAWLDSKTCLTGEDPSHETLRGLPISHSMRSSSCRSVDHCPFFPVGKGADMIWIFSLPIFHGHKAGLLGTFACFSYVEIVGKCERRAVVHKFTQSTRF
jgi:hypothetical protein